MSKAIVGCAASAPRNRRSWLLVAASGAAQIEEAARSGVDVVVLDLVELIAARDKAAVRSNFRAALAGATNAGVEVFAQIDPSSAQSDLAACVWPGLAGIVISRAEAGEQIEEVSTTLDRLEQERGIAPGSVQIVAALETAK